MSTIKSGTNDFTKLIYTIWLKPAYCIYTLVFFLFNKSNKKILEGRSPSFNSINLPVKSFQKVPKIRLTKSSSALPAPLLSTGSLKEEKSKCYQHYKEFCEWIAKLKFSGETTFSYACVSLSCLCWKLSPRLVLI